MKKLFLVALAALCSHAAFAREVEVNPREITHHNNVEFSAGFASLNQIVAGLSFSLSNIDVIGDVYELSENRQTIPSLSLSYGRQITPLINVGLMLNYGQVSTALLRKDDGSEAGRYSMADYAIMPTVRFDWLRLKHFRLYSRLGFGAGPHVYSEQYDDPLEDDVHTVSTSEHLDIVPLGIAAGGKLYGTAEVSFGTIGFVKVGVGYRF